MTLSNARAAEATILRVIFRRNILIIKIKNIIEEGISKSRTSPNSKPATDILLTFTSAFRKQSNQLKKEGLMT